MNIQSFLTFTLLAALLTAAVLALLLPPLWRGGSGRRAAWALGVGLPLLAASLYLAKGQPGAWEAQARQPAGPDLDAMATQMLRQLEAGRDAAQSAPAPGADPAGANGAKR